MSTFYPLNSGVTSLPPIPVIHPVRSLYCGIFLSMYMLWLGAHWGWSQLCDIRLNVVTETGAGLRVLAVRMFPPLAKKFPQRGILPSKLIAIFFFYLMSLPPTTN